jgi:hypothetical protein
MSQIQTCLLLSASLKLSLNRTKTPGKQGRAVTPAVNPEFWWLCNGLKRVLTGGKCCFVDNTFQS